MIHTIFTETLDFSFLLWDLPYCSNSKGSCYTKILLKQTCISIIYFSLKKSYSMTISVSLNEHWKMNPDVFMNLNSKNQ